MKTLVRLIVEVSIISWSGVFYSPGYRSKYFGGYYVPDIFCIIHYVLYGQRKGYKSNPFFDAFYSEWASGAPTLGQYLLEKRLWSEKISNFFDGQFYLEQHSSYISTAENPLKHFMREGFELDFSPHPRVNMSFLKRAIGRDYIDRMQGCWDYLDEKRPSLPLNIDELRSCQAKFKSSISVEILKGPEGDKRRHLVFLQSGNNRFLSNIGEDRSFDVVVNYYDDSFVSHDQARAVIRQKGTKTTAVSKLFQEERELLSEYESVLLLDDDVEVDQIGLERLFKTFTESALDLAQASLSSDSFCSFEILKQPHAGGGISRMSTVEIMMPLLSKRALEKCGWVFDQGISGWCIDALLGSEVRRAFGDTVALVGDVVFKHRDPIDFENGAFYRFLRQNGITPSVEAGAIAIEYNIFDKPTYVRRLRQSDPQRNALS